MIPHKLQEVLSLKTTWYYCSMCGLGGHDRAQLQFVDPARLKDKLSMPWAHP